MKEPPRSRVTADDTLSATPHRRRSSALAHDNAGGSHSGDPRRSAGRPPQTPRGARPGDRPGRPGTLPPVPGRPNFFPAQAQARSGSKARSRARALTPLLCLALFALIAWQVAAHGPLYGWDRAVDASVLREAAAERSVRPVAQFLSDLGDLPVALPVLACALGWAAWRLGRWREAVVYAVAMACAAPIVVLLKALVARPAPGTARLVAHSGYFPSGHAMTAAAAYGLAALALMPSPERVTARRALGASAVPLNVAVGAGLVWRGYHWPLDVAASWCLAGALLAAAYRVSRSWGSPGSAPRATGPASAG